MGFLASVQKAGQRAKLQGEIMLLDRELVARKKQFGIELYDLIATLDQKNRDAVFATPAVFKGVEAHIKGPLEECRRDLMLWEGEKAEKEDALRKLDVKRDRQVDGGLGSWVSNSTEEAQLNVRLTILERNIKQRKEQFGLDVWDIIAQPTGVADNVSAEVKKAKGALGAVKGAVGGIAKGVVGTASTGLGKLSPSERQIQNCIDKAKEDVGFTERSKQRKQTIVNDLKG